MKKLLVASTALVAVAAVSSAQAADPIKLGLGGFMTQGIAYVNYDLASSTVDTQNEVREYSDTEIYFTGSTKLDNGLTVSALIQKEADRGASGQDDVTLAVASDTMGSVTLGATKSAAWNHRNNGWGKDASGFLSTFDGVGSFAPTTVGSNAADGSALYFADSVSGANDGQGIKYQSPSFGGVSVALSWQTNTSEGSSGAIAKDFSDTQNIAYSVGYKGEFSGVAVGLNAARNISDIKTNSASTVEANLTETLFGVSVGVAGFSVGASYKDVNNLGGTKDQDGDYWDLGVSYATGPYKVSATYVAIQAEQSSAANAKEDEAEIISAAVAYDLGAGVSLFGGVAQYDISSGTNTKADESDAWVATTGLSVSF